MIDPVKSESNQIAEDYVKWLIYDQAIGILNLNENYIATRILHITRQTLRSARINQTLRNIPYVGIRNLEEYLAVIKASLLTTEKSDD